MDNGYINNIFFIKNDLEKFALHLQSISDDFNFCETTLDNLTEAIKSRQHLTKLKNKNSFTVENNLIIISRDFYFKKLKKINENLFLADFNNNPPHYLFINNSESPEVKKQSQEFDSDDFFYQYTDTEEENGKLLINSFFLTLLFHCISNRKRVHAYIVNSFQTIVESTIIAKQKVQIEKLFEELEELNKIDVLTNVLSRKALFEAMDMEKTRTLRDYKRLKHINEQNDPERRSAQTLSPYYGRFACLMIDIDDFKTINDTYGHLVGDDVLRKIGQLLTEENLFRDNDIVGRYGGEEFVVILPETSAQLASHPAERLRQAMKAIEFGTNKGIFQVTLSIGITEFSPTDTNCDQVIFRADKALYHAKKLGKDQVVIYEESINTNS